MTAVAVQQNGEHGQQYYNGGGAQGSTQGSLSRADSATYATTQQAAAQPGRSTNGNVNGAHNGTNVSAVSSNGNHSAVNGLEMRSSSNPSLSRMNGVANTQGLSSAQGQYQGIEDIRTQVRRDRGLSDAQRDSSGGDSEAESIRRPNQMLQRSHSDYGPRNEESEQEALEEVQEWGARHGFDDHYASEEFVTQLASVGRSFSFSMQIYPRAACLFPWVYGTCSVALPTSGSSYESQPDGCTSDGIPPFHKDT
jgi:regulator-associated protein of mTOR